MISNALAISSWINANLRMYVKVQLILVIFVVLCQTMSCTTDFEFPDGSGDHTSKTPITDTDGVIFGLTTVSGNRPTGENGEVLNAASNVKVTVMSNAILAYCIGWKIVQNICYLKF